MPRKPDDHHLITLQSPVQILTSQLESARANKRYPRVKRSSPGQPPSSTVNRRRPWGGEPPVQNPCHATQARPRRILQPKLPHGMSRNRGNCPEGARSNSSRFIVVSPCFHSKPTSPLLTSGTQHLRWGPSSDQADGSGEPVSLLPHIRQLAAHFAQINDPR